MQMRNSAAAAETEVIPAVKTSLPSEDGFMDATGQEFAAPKRSHKALYITLASVIGTLVVLSGIAFCMGHFFFENRAPLGASFAGESVAGKTSAELEDLVTEKIASTKFALSTSEGTTAEASYADLGVTPEVKATVQALLDARGDNAFAKVNPFGGPTVALVAKTDKTVMQSYLIDHLVKEDSQVVLPTVTYDAPSNSFAVTEGKDGQVATSESTQKAVEASFTQAAAEAKVSVELTDQKAPISQETAQKAAEEATARLSRKLVVNNGSKKTFTVPAAQIGAWTKVEPDTDKGTMEVAYDTDAIKKYMEETLPNELKQDKVDQENMVTPAGRQLQVKVQGVDGVEVADSSEAIAQVSKALVDNTDVEASVTTTVTKHGSKNVPPPSNFGVANGDPWIRIDLSNQRVTAYKGTTVVNSFNVSTGKATADRQSDNGTFYVYLKYESQTMRGEGYVSPNVQWVSYYNGGEAFHSAPWNTSNIANGLATSHGCINMNPSDAKWMYDFAVIGTKVEVVGSTSSAAVRAVAATPDPAATPQQ